MVLKTSFPACDWDRFKRCINHAGAERGSSRSVKNVFRRTDGSIRLEFKSQFLKQLHRPQRRATRRVLMAPVIIKVRLAPMGKVRLPSSYVLGFYP